MGFQGLMMDFLKAYSKTYITLGQLEQNCPGNVTYLQFADYILALERQGLLKKVAAAGVNGKEPLLANKYAVQKAELQTHHQQIKQTQLAVHALINLDHYFKLSAKTWRSDAAYIEKIDAYLKDHGLPPKPASMPQRSYELVGNEKWLEQGGAAVLQRIGLYESMRIESTADPLMLAINPAQIRAARHWHLVVENKTTYYALAPALKHTVFTTLVYGQGWKAAANLHLLPDQLNLKEAEHRIYYFGDLDAEGVAIWWGVHQRIPALPAAPFYRAFLNKTAETGKQNQRLDQKAWRGFLNYFNPRDKQTLIDLLAGGKYYPQEALDSARLQQIWSDSIWNNL